MSNYLLDKQYQEYCKYMEMLGIQPLSEDEFHNGVENEKLKEHSLAIESKLENMGKIGGFIGQNINKAINNPAVRKNFENAARRTMDEAFNMGKSYLHGMSWGQGVNAVIDFFQGGGGSDGGGKTPNGPGSGGHGGSKSRSVGALTNSLQFKENPLEIKLDTGIQNRVWTSPTLSGSAEFVPMHMNSIKISLENLLANGDVSEYFYKAFYTQLLNVAQRKVNFSVGTLTAFDLSNIKKYFDALIDGLNMYFFVMSIINYSDNVQNNNYAMLDLRNRITADMLNYFVILQRQLTVCPVPPKLMNILYYLNGNFKANHLDGSAIIKFETTTLNLDTLKSVTDKLKDVQGTISLMSRIFPEWLYPDLPTYPGTGFHDYNFCTIWTNAPYTVDLDGGPQNGPFVFYPDDKSIVYQSFSSELDGASFAFTSIYDSGNFAPGLTQPKYSSLTANKTSRISWDHNNGWVPSQLNTSYMAARLDTYPACAIGTSFLYNPEVRSICEPVKSVNLQVIRQAHFDFIDLMASFDSIKMESADKKESDSKRSSQRKSRSRRK